MGPEAKLEQKLRNAVVAAGGMTIKLGSPSGIPDRLVILPGRFVHKFTLVEKNEAMLMFTDELDQPWEPPRFIFIEMKAERGRLSRLQQLRIAQLISLGCEVRVIQGAEQTEAFIRELHER